MSRSTRKLTQGQTVRVQIGKNPAGHDDGGDEHEDADLGLEADARGVGHVFHELEVASRGDFRQAFPGHDVEDDGDDAVHQSGQNAKDQPEGETRLVGTQILGQLLIRTPESGKKLQKRKFFSSGH